MTEGSLAAGCGEGAAMTTTREAPWVQTGEELVRFSFLHLLSELTAAQAHWVLFKADAHGTKSNESALRRRAFSEKQGNQHSAQGPATPKKNKGHRMVHDISCSPTGHPTV